MFKQITTYLRTLYLYKMLSLMLFSIPIILEVHQNMKKIIHRIFIDPHLYRSSCLILVSPQFLIDKTHFNLFIITNLSYRDKFSILNINPVFAVKHFQYRVETFCKVFIIDGPFEKSKYYAIRVEFQIRGGPHIHYFIWIIYALKISTKNIWVYNVGRWFSKG